METDQYKISFEGVIRSVQPRSTVWRYRLDNRTHNVIGFNLFLSGTAEGEEKDFVVAISGKQQEKLCFHIGDEISGTAWTKLYPKLEFADYYRVAALKKRKAVDAVDEESREPWLGETPGTDVYNWRGCRMLDKRTWSKKCFQCKWAAMANVTIEYNWGVSQKFRFESFCYGPKSCGLYNGGKPRAVPYIHEGSDYDDGWLDEICTERRDSDD